jgi:hypothetical protein
VRRHLTASCSCLALCANKPEISTGLPTHMQPSLSRGCAPRRPGNAGNYTNTPGRVPAGDSDGRTTPARPRSETWTTKFPDVTDPRDPDLPDGWQAPEDADTGF